MIFDLLTGEVEILKLQVGQYVEFHVIALYMHSPFALAWLISDLKKRLLKITFYHINDPTRGCARFYTTSREVVQKRCNVMCTSPSTLHVFYSFNPGLDLKWWRHNMNVKRDDCYQILKKSQISINILLVSNRLENMYRFR